MTLDAIDLKILAILQQDASIAIADLANRVGLSPTPCWKRVQKLESAQVITNRVAVVDPQKLGLGLTVFVSIETDDHSEPWLAHFAENLQLMPEVMDVYRMAGDVDYLLRVVVTDMAAFDAFYRRLIKAAPVKKVTSRFAMERVKASTVYAPPSS